MRDTIVALASGTGGAIAVLRISGKEAFEEVKKIVKEKEKFENQKQRYAEMFHLEADDNILDEVLIIKFKEPRSFTGENVVEIFCHGGRKVTETIIEELCKRGCRNAQRGEYTRRAFENGKTDLARAEAINLLVSGVQETAVKSAMNTFMGGHKKRIKEWKTSLKNIQAHLESLIEFGEEDDIRQSDDLQKEKKEIIKIRDQITDQIVSWDKLVAREEGIEVVLVGPPNAGKSSLMNALLGFERSIVYSEAGTTRDVVSENMVGEGKELRLIDTAGLCETEESVERIGVEKAWELIEKSYLVIWVSNVEEEIKEEEKKIIEKRRGKKILCVLNKTDKARNEEKEMLCRKENIPFVMTCAINGDGIDVLRGKIVELIEGEKEESSFIVSKRQGEIMKKAVKKVEKIEKEMMEREEIAAHYCKEAISLFDDFEGYNASEDVLNRIFNEFCIGK